MGAADRPRLKFFWEPVTHIIIYINVYPVFLFPLGHKILLLPANRREIPPRDDKMETNYDRGYQIWACIYCHLVLNSL